MSGRVKFQTANNLFIFLLEGYVEKSVSQKLIEEFRRQWQKGVRYFLFDFSKITIINSVALGDMLEIVSEGIGESDSCFYICAVPEKTYWGLSSIGLLNYMTEFDSFEQARKELGFYLV